MYKKAKFLAKEAKLRVEYMVSRDCIFCKIIGGKMKTKFIKENEKVVVFDDVNPVADTHILVVPKKHIKSTATIAESDGDDIVEMFRVASEVAKEKKLQAYRLSFNVGTYQHVPHLHMHLLAGGKIQWSKL